MITQLITDLFLTAIFISIIPPFKIPLLNYNWSNSYLISRALIFLIFLYLLIKGFFKKNFFKNSIFGSIIVFFTFQSLSILGAQNILAFLQRYEKLLFGMITFFIGVFLARRNASAVIKKTIFVFLLAGTIKLSLEYLLFFKPEQFVNLATYILHPGLLQTIEANLGRERTYLDLFQEVSLPFFLTYLTKDGWPVKTVALLLALLLGIISFLSNWRGRFLVLLFLLVFYLVIYRSKVINHLKLFFLVSVMVVIFFSILDRSIVKTQGFSVIDRLTNKDKQEDELTIKWRIRMFQESVAMAYSYPFGVGLGNFYDKLQTKPKTKSLIKEKNILTESASIHGPHNIISQYLAETGFAGVTVFLIMLLMFSFNDFWLLKTRQEDSKTAIVIGFWGLLAVVFFYPATDLSFYLSFFLFRSLLSWR